MKKILYLFFLVSFFSFGQSEFIITNKAKKTKTLIANAVKTVSTCIDGIQNGTETGIDCGGSCIPCAPVTNSTRIWSSKEWWASLTGAEALQYLNVSTSGLPSYLNPDGAVVWAILENRLTSASFNYLDPRTIIANAQSSKGNTLLPYVTTSANDARVVYHASSWNPIGTTNTSHISHAYRVYNDFNTTNTGLALNIKNGLDALPVGHKAIRIFRSVMRDVRVENANGRHPNQGGDAGPMDVRSGYAVPWYDDWIPLFGNDIKSLMTNLNNIGGTIDEIILDTEIRVGYHLDYDAAAYAVVKADPRWPELEAELQKHGYNTANHPGHWGDANQRAIWNGVMRNRWHRALETAMNYTKQVYPNLVFNDYDSHYISNRRPVGNFYDIFKGWGTLGTPVGDYQTYSAYNYTTGVQRLPWGNVNPKYADPGGSRSLPSDGWDALISDTDSAREASASSNLPSKPWIGSDDYIQDWYTGTSENKWYKDTMYHVALSGNVIGYLFYNVEGYNWNGGTQSDERLNNILIELSDRIGYVNHRPLDLEPIFFGKDYVISGVDAGGKLTYRVSWDDRVITDPLNQIPFPNGVVEMDANGVGAWVTDTPTAAPLTSACVSCPNLESSLTWNASNEFTPTTAADLTNSSNANKVALISNSFSISNITFAANMTIVPRGGTLTGTNVNLNGATIAINSQKAFSTSTRFTSLYLECLSPETFGANSLTNDSSAFEAMVLNSEKGTLEQNGSYQFNSTKTFTGNRLFKLNGNNSTITSTYDQPELSDWVWLFDNEFSLEMCNVTLDGQDLVQRWMRFHHGADCDFTNVTVKNIEADTGKFSAAVIAYVYANLGSTFKFTDCVVDGVLSGDDGNPAAGSGSISRALYFNYQNVTGTPKPEGEYYIHIKGGAYKNVTAVDADGIHFQNTTGNYGASNVVIPKIEGATFSGNWRRDIKDHAGKAKVHGNTFYKMNAANITGNSGNIVTTNVSFALNDPNSDTFVTSRWNDGPELIDNIFIGEYAEGVISTFANLSSTKNAIVRGNTFNNPSASGTGGLGFQRKHENNLVYNNTFINCGILTGGFHTDPTTSFGSRIYNNTFDYTIDSNSPMKGADTSLATNGTSLATGGYSGAVFIKGAQGDTTGFLFENNTGTINFTESNSNWRGVLHINKGDTSAITKSIFRNNTFTVTGTQASTMKFMEVRGALNSTFEVTGNVINGITSSGSIIVTSNSTGSFTNTNNTNGSNALTIQ